MSDFAIRVENLSKRYVLSHKGSSSGDGLRHALQDKLAAPFRSLKEKLQRRNPPSAPLSPSSFLPSTLERASTEEFYALRDVSFEITQREVVTIIGHHGPDECAPENAPPDRALPSCPSRRFPVVSSK